MKKIAIIGTGGFAGEVYTMLKQNHESLPDGMFEYCFVDTHYKGGMFFNMPVIDDSEIETDMILIFAVGDPELRSRLVRSYFNILTDQYFSIHSIIGENCIFGENVLIMQGCILTNHITIGNYTHINIGCTIGHDTKIGDFVTINPGCNISGNVKIGNNVYIGTNTCIRQGIEICDNVTIGMGSVVVKDITEHGTYFGNPCKRQK